MTTSWDQHQQEFYQYRVPTLSSITSDVFDDDGNPCFWTVNNGFLDFSMFCNWRF